jgi:hypothetical protein
MTRLNMRVDRRRGMVAAALLLLAAPIYFHFGRSLSAEPAGVESAETRKTPATEAYAKVLGQFVDDRGLVNYKELKQDRALLDEYTASLAALDPAAREAMSNPEKIALWINAYNALTLKTIVDHYPIESRGLIAGLRFPDESIRQIPGVWAKLEHVVMGQPLTLDHIEHRILRERFHEPRIHMALVCAAMSCPPLRAEPFAADRLDEQFADQTRRFLADPRRFRIDRDNGVVHLSSIFEWFAEDFPAAGPAGAFAKHSKAVRGVLEFLAGHLNRDDARYLREADFRIQSLDYDWSLNRQP